MLAGAKDVVDVQRHGLQKRRVATHNDKIDDLAEPQILSFPNPCTSLPYALKPEPHNTLRLRLALPP